VASEPYDYLRDGYKVGEYGFLTVGMEGTVTALGKPDWIEIEGTRLPLKFGTPGVVHLSMLPPTDEAEDAESDDMYDYDAAMAIENTIAAIDRLTGADPEADHGLADDLLLSLLPDGVADAYRRLVDRIRWWGAA